MRVLCCYANNDGRSLRAETRAAIESFCPDAEFVDCTRSQTLYHETLERYWQAGSDWMNVEHDIVIDDCVPDTFQKCREPWCVFMYELACGFTPGALGCVRFRSQLMAELPDAMRDAGRADTSGVVAGAWYRTDVRLDRILRDRGYLPHIHGRVQHLNEKQKLADPEAAYRETLERCAEHVAAGVAA